MTTANVALLASPRVQRVLYPTVVAVVLLATTVG